MREAFRAAVPVSTVLAGLGVALLGTSPPQCPGADEPCPILESDDAIYLSGPGEAALRRLCGQWPAEDGAVGATALPPLAPRLVSGIGGTSDVQVNRLPDPPPRTTQSEVTLAETRGVLVAGWNDSSHWVDQGPLFDSTLGDW